MTTVLGWQKVAADRIEREAKEARAIIRRQIATAALAGLLADPKDHDDERKKEHREVTVLDTSKGGSWRKKEWQDVYVETCAQAVARLAVEHADALMEQLERT